MTLGTHPPAHEPPAPSAAPPLSETRTRAFPTGTDLPPLDPQMRDRLHTLTNDLATTGAYKARLVGFRVQDATTHWMPGPTPESIKRVFHIEADGDAPSPETTELILSRLSSRGWRGLHTGRGEVFRAEAEREGWRLWITGKDGRISMTIETVPVIVGADVAKRILAGIHQPQIG